MPKAQLELDFSHPAKEQAASSKRRVPTAKRKPRKVEPTAPEATSKSTHRKYSTTAQVCERYQVKRQTLWRWALSEKGFPKGIVFSPQVVRWSIEELDAYDARVAASGRKGGGK